MGHIRAAGPLAMRKGLVLARQVLRGMPMRSVGWITCLLIAATLAGCAAEGASTSNFLLTPHKVGWYAGDEASFTLRLEPTFFKSDPSFTVDRHFAIEEIKFEEEGLTFGGDFDTRNPDEVKLRLLRDGMAAEEFDLDAENPEVEVRLVLPDDLRDSSYTLSIKLFEVGWIESGVFRVDHR